MKRIILAAVLLGLALGPVSFLIPVVHVSAQSGAHWIDVYWQLNSANASVNLYRSATTGTETLYQKGLTSTVSTGCPTVVGSPCGHYADVGLNANVTMFYKVTGVNSNGLESALSAETSCTTLADAPVVPGVSCKGN